MPNEQNNSSRIALIKIIKTPLAFFVLIALIVETILGVLSASTKGQMQAISLYSILGIFLLLIIIVTLLTFLKPANLLGSSFGSQGISEFCNSIEGDWWESVTPNDSSALSFVSIKQIEETNSVKINGITYNLKGERIADWESYASSINLNDSKVFYYWKGHHISSPGTPYEGVGEITFYDSQKKITNGKGRFSDINITDLKTLQWKSTIFKRCKPQEIEIITKGDNQAILRCVSQVLSLMA